MPILKGSVSFSRFRLEHLEKPPSDEKRWLLKGLKQKAFEPLDKAGEDDRVAGFVELENADGVEFPASALFHGERALFTWRVDTLRISASQLKAELDRWAQKFEAENERKPSRNDKTKAKAELKFTLRKRAEPVTKTHDVALNLKTGQLQVWTSARRVIDEVAANIEQAFEVRLVPLVPSALAASQGLPEAALGPTAALVGVEGLEVSVGEA